MLKLRGCYVPCKVPPFNPPTPIFMLLILAEILPDVEYIYTLQQKQLKKRMLGELPRRSSDRIAIKAAIKEEEVRGFRSIYACVDLLFFRRDWKHRTGRRGGKS